MKEITDNRVALEDAQGTVKSESSGCAMGEPEARALFMGIPEAAVYWDPGFRVLDINPRFSELFGYSLDEIRGRNSTSFLVPKDRIRESNILGRKAREGYVNHDTVRKRKDGSPVLVSMSVAPMIVEGRLIGYVGLYKDISAQKKMENELRETKEFLYSLLDYAPIPIYVTSSDDRYSLVNQAWEKFSKVKREKAIGCQLERVFSPETARQFHEVNQQVIKTATPVFMEEFVDASDGRHYFHTVKFPLFSATRQIEAVGGISIDITRRKQAEKELRRSEEQSRYLLEFQNKVIDTAIVWIDLLDADGNVTLWNRAAELISGYSREEVIGHGRIWEWLYPDSKYRTEVFAKAKRIIGEGEKAEHFKTIIKCKDGTLKTVSWHSNNILDELGKPVGSIAVGLDVTEIKKARERAKDSEEKYRNLFENAQDIVVTIDLEGKITSVNHAVQKHGYDRNELIGKSVFDLIPKEECPGRQRNMQELAQGRPTESEFKIETKNELGYAIVEARSIPISQGNEVVGIQTIMRDVTERREMEEKLRESEEKLRAITVSANDAILLIDEEGKFSYWNPAAEKMFGYTEAEVENKKMHELITPERLRGDHTKAFEKFKETGEGRIIGKTVEMAAVRKDGTEFPVEFSLSTLQVKGKQYALGIFRDVTERKKMEAKLKQYSEHLEELVQKKTDELLESEKRYSVLVEEASDGVAILQDGKLVFINKKGLELIGFSRGEVIGLPFKKLVCKKYHRLLKERYTQRMQGKTVPATSEYELLAKNGERVPVEVSGTLIRYQGRPADLIIVREIRDRRRMEEERLRLEKLATVGELATMVAHDLRNPLTSIRNASFYVKNTCPHCTTPECKEALEMLDIIEQETLAANNIINDLLDFAAKRPLEKKKQNLNNIIENVLTKSNIPDNIDVNRNFAEKPIATVDEKQLERVFLNLIKNAVQAMPDGGELTITTNETKDDIEMSITDTGVGIPEENMSKIFQPLFTTKAKGIGIGLSICKNIIEQHSGAIDVKSQVGRGTTVVIKLPKMEGRDRQ